MGEPCGMPRRSSRLGRACLPSSIVGFFHGAVQPHLDQMQHAPINDPARYRLQKLGMGNAPEVVRKVGVHNFRMAAKQQLLNLDHRLLGVSPATVGKSSDGRSASRSAPAPASLPS